MLTWEEGAGVLGALYGGTMAISSMESSSSSIMALDLMTLRRRAYEVSNLSMAN